MNNIRYSILAAVALTASAGSAQATILTAPTVTGSSPAFSGAYAASNTVNGTEAEYASAGQGAATFIDYSFGAPATFNRIVVINRDSGGQSDLIGNFTLTMDGGPTSAITRTAMRGLSQFHDTGTFTATTVRLQVNTIGIGDSFNNTGAMEVIFAQTPTGMTQIGGVTVVGSATPFNANFDASNAVDGNIGRISAITGTTDWPEYASQSLGAGAFVDFDLGSTVPVGGFDWFDRPGAPDRVTGFDMIFSQDAVFGNGDDITRSYTNSAMAKGDAFAPINARFVRYDVTANAGGPTANTGMSEMIFYQVPEPSAALLFLTLAGISTLRRRR